MILKEFESLKTDQMRKNRSPKCWKKGWIFDIFSGSISTQLQGIVKNHERTDQRLEESNFYGGWIMFRRLLSSYPCRKTSLPILQEMMLSEVLPTIPEESTSSDMRSDIPVIQVASNPKKDVDVFVPTPPKY